PVPALNTFSQQIAVDQDALINSDYPDINLNDWKVREKDGIVRVLTVGGNQWAVLRWDLARYKGAKVEGAGLLELTTQAVAAGGDYGEVYGAQLGEEFPRLRVIEIVGGPAEWEQERVTYLNFMQEEAYAAVFNTQMIYDIELDDRPG